MKKMFTLLFVFQSMFFLAQNKINETRNFIVSNVSVISMTKDEVVKNQDVIVQNGKIISIGKTKKIKDKNATIYDGTGKFIMPSLADAHVHFPETEPEMERVLQLNLINGVTKLRSMRGDWMHKEWRNKYNSIDSYYPKLYLSPPPITRNSDLNLEQIESFVKAAKENGFDFLKVLSLKNDVFFKQLDSVCKKYNFSISGHFPFVSIGNQLEDKTIFASNYNSFEHLGGLSGETDDKIDARINIIKNKEIVICPTLSWYNVGSGRYSLEELRNLRGMEFVSKIMMDKWISETKAYREKIGNEAYQTEVAKQLKSLEAKYIIIKKLDKAGVKMILSPDASSKFMMAGSTILDEMELLKNADLSNFSILKMATTNFANFFKENYGTLEVGKTADFIVLEKNPLQDLNALKEIKAVYTNNHFINENNLKEIRQQLINSVEL